jgi:PPOX class probable F420-dependent enzyme
MAEAHPFAALAGEEFLVLTTYRKSGTAVPTTVWFAEEDGTLYIVTGASAGKVKRIRHDTRVLVTPSDRRGQTHGETVAGRARVLEAGTEVAARADRALDRKYGAQRASIVGMLGMSHASVFLAVTASRQD